MSRLPTSVPSLLFCLLAASVPGCSGPAPTKSIVAGDRKPAPVPVRTVVAESQPAPRTTTQPASVEAYQVAEVRCQVEGYVVKVNVDLGDEVQANQVLAVVDIPELRQQLLVAAARVAREQAGERRAEAARRLAKAQLDATRATVTQAQARVAAAQANGAAADAEHSRVAALVAQQALQSRVLDEARQRHAAAQAEIDAARSGVTQAESEVATAEAALAAAGSSVEAAQADVALASAEQEALAARAAFAELRAPFAGVLTQRGVDEGDLVGASTSPPLFVVAQVDKLRIRTAVPERDAALVDVGDTATLTLASGGDPLPVRVARTSRSLDPQTRMLQVELELVPGAPPETGEPPRAASPPLPGMYGEATIQLDSAAPAVVLPASAVRFDAQGKSFVYAIEEGLVRVVPVEVASDDGRRIALGGQVVAGQRVIDAHLRRFRDGDPVIVVAGGW